MKNLTILLIVVVSINFYLITLTYAQTSVVQDTKGETSLNLGNQGVVSFNAKDESISFSFGSLLGDFKDKDKRRLSYFGLKTKAKGKGSIAPLLKNEDFTYDGSLGLFVFSTITHITGPIDRTDHFFIGADYLSARIKLYDNTKAFVDQVHDQTIGGSRFTLGYNQENSFRFKAKNLFSYLFGIALVGGNRNNTEDIKTVQTSIQTSYTDPLTGQVRLIQQDLSAAYETGKFKNSLGYFNLNIDIGPQVGERFLLLLHPRYSVLEGRKPQFNPAIGLYITKLKAPLEVIAGLQVQILDYANTAVLTPFCEPVLTGVYAACRYSTGVMNFNA